MARRDVQCAGPSRQAVSSGRADFCCSVPLFVLQTHGLQLPCACTLSRPPTQCALHCTPPFAAPCSAVTGGRLRCTHLPGELAHLPALQFLDLKCNALNSSVPAEWRAAGSFPVLQTLNLGETFACRSVHPSRRR